MCMCLFVLFVCVCVFKYLSALVCVRFFVLVCDWIFGVCACLGDLYVFVCI